LLGPKSSVLGVLTRLEGRKEGRKEGGKFLLSSFFRTFQNISLVDLFPLSLARGPSSPGSFQGSLSLSLSLYLKFRIKNLINNLRC
jgi:hypothetical protein